MDRYIKSKVPYALHTKADKKAMQYEMVSYNYRKIHKLRLKMAKLQVVNKALAVFGLLFVAGSVYAYNITSDKPFARLNQSRAASEAKQPPTCTNNKATETVIMPDKTPEFVAPEDCK